MVGLFDFTVENVKLKQQETEKEHQIAWIDL